MEKLKGTRRLERDGLVIEALDDYPPYKTKLEIHCVGEIDEMRKRR